MLRIGFFGMAALLVTKSCTITFGNPPPPDQVNGFTLGVPYYKQIGPQDCGAASVQMWAAYDKDFVTQQTIAASIGLDPASGVSREEILNGVHQFTSSGATSIIDFPGGQVDPNNPHALFDSAEITSMNDKVPVLPIVNEGQYHAGIIDGGEWHMDDTGSLYIWDTVYFHDPLRVPDRTIAAGDWDNYAVAHIIISSASTEASSNYSQYHTKVFERGSAGIPHGPQQI